MLFKGEGQSNKENKEVVIVLFVIGIIIFLFLWRFIIATPEPISPPGAIMRQAPEIDFDYLRSPEFKRFQEYQSIDPLEEDLMGRDNPFLPY